MFSPRYLTVILALVAVPLWSQVDSTGAQPAATGIMDTNDRMFVPTPVSGEGYPLAFASETSRSNYLRAGVTLGSGYDDNIGPSTASGISDVSYSVWPSISLDQSRPRLHWDLTYRPGFTFYQHHASLNEADQNVTFGLEYRLSPHLTLSLHEFFQKTSDVLANQNPETSTSGVVQEPNTSVIPPITDVITTFGNAELTYQLSPSAMVGAKGTLSELRYLNRDEVPGLFDSTTKAAEVFYTHRLSGRHYLGTTYEIQNLRAYPSPVKTETHSVLFFYTLYLQPRLSLSVFTGPEYTHIYNKFVYALHDLSPAAGVSVGWQGTSTSLAASYSHRTGEGAGLGEAVRFSRVEASARWQLARTVTASLGANYTLNTVVGSPTGDAGGHTVLGYCSLERAIRDDLHVRIGYTRVHQNYSKFFIASATPNRNSVYISLSYQFQRPLGR